MCHAYIWTHPKLSPLKQVIALNFASDRVINSWLSFLSLSICLKLYWTVNAALADLIVSCFPSPISDNWRSIHLIWVCNHKVNSQAVILLVFCSIFMNVQSTWKNSCQSASFHLFFNGHKKKSNYLTILHNEEMMTQRIVEQLVRFEIIDAIKNTEKSFNFFLIFKVSPFYFSSKLYPIFNQSDLETTWNNINLEHTTCPIWLKNSTSKNLP